MFKRFIVVALSVAVLASAASALDFDQKEFYGQAVLALPIGNLSNIASIGFGAGVGLKAPSSDVLSFRGEISYIYFSTKDLFGVDWSWSLLPINILAEYHLDSLYLLGGLGLTFAMSEFKDKDNPAFSYSSTGSDIGLVLGAGFELSPSMILEGRLNVISGSNFLSGNLVFRF